MADLIPVLLLPICLFIYVLDICLLALYGFHSLLQTLLFTRYRLSQAKRQVTQPLTVATPSATPSASLSLGQSLDSGARFGAAASSTDATPAVTIQLPIYNERHVAQRLIKAVAAMDWPNHKLQIQVLDDSTDDTTLQIQETVAELLTTCNIAIEHHHRRDRTGYKAGALHQGLTTATGEFVAIFDADFIPQPDFLQRTIPAFQDENVGCVQARWGHLNPRTSLLTRAQAIGIDGHFVIEQQVRHLTGAFLNFNGTAGIWRQASLDHAGGWQGDTLTEDLDLSYRMQLKGWRIAYLPEVVVPAELPVQLYALKRQQFRWAKGSIQTAMKLWRPLWRSRQPLWRKCLASLHLTQYAVHPLMLLNLLLIWPVLQSQSNLLRLTPLVTIAALGPPLMYWITMGYQGMGKLARIGRLGSLLALGTGLSVNNSWAVLQALLGIKSEFKRTPKFAVVNRTTSWQASSYVLSGGWLLWVEVLLGLYALYMISYSVTMEQWGMMPWLMLYASGYAMVVGLTMVQSWQQRRAIQQRQQEALTMEKLSAAAENDYKPCHK